MTSNVTKLTRLSRNKTTGNIIIFVLILICVTYFLSVFGKGLSTNVDKLIFLGAFFLSILFSYLVDRRLRQPFFLEISRYLRELEERRFNVQQVAIQVELIEPLQPLAALKTVLLQMDDLYIEIEENFKLTTNEISMNSPHLRTQQIQSELKGIINLVEQARKVIKRKRKNILFLAKVRQNILTSIKTHISRPRNEIESDYLLFKVQRDIHDHFIDNNLFRQILDHALSQGEIFGRIDHNQVGESVLFVESSNGIEEVSDFSWEKSDQHEKQCVICRFPIRSDADNVSCPFCQNIFHRNHLLEWLKVFNQCPMCHQRLTFFSNPS